jgi:haloalkane dehalogenase
MIGMGRSDKPPIEYTITDHIRYIDAFIDALKLKEVTLVMHGWGSLVGFDYARRHEKNVRGVAFVETFLYPPSSREQMSLAVLEMASILKQSDGGFDAIMHKNYYLNVELPSLVLRKLSKMEITQYQMPFLTPDTCKPLWQYAREFPLGDKKSEGAAMVAFNLMEQHTQWLQKTLLPKLMMYAVPGYLTTIATVKWARDHLSHLTLADVGDALHYPQESDPELLSEKLQNWYLTL